MLATASFAACCRIVGSQAKAPAQKWLPVSLKHLLAQLPALARFQAGVHHQVGQVLGWLGIENPC